MKKLVLFAAMLTMSLPYCIGQEESVYTYLKEGLSWVENLKLKDGTKYTGYVNANGQPDVYGTKVNGKAYTTSQIKNGVANGMLYLFDGVSTNYSGESKDDMLNGIGSMIVNRDRCMATFKNNKFADGLASRVLVDYDDPNVFMVKGQPGPSAIEIFVKKIYTDNFSKIKQLCEASNVRYVENMDCKHDYKDYKYTGGWKDGHPYFYGAYKNIYYGTKSSMCACGYINYNNETGGWSVEKEFEVYAKNSYQYKSYYEYNSCQLKANGDTIKVTQAYDYYNYAVIDKEGKFKEWTCLEGNNYTKFLKYVGERPWGLYFTPESMYEGYLEGTKEVFKCKKISKYGELTKEVDGHTMVFFADGSSLTIYKSNHRGDVLGLYIIKSGDKAIGWFSRNVAQYEYATKPDGYASTIFPIAVKEYFNDNEFKRDYVYNQQYPEWEEDILPLIEELTMPNNGRASFTFNNGNVYEGEWKNKKPNGNGKMTYVDGHVYEGSWEDGSPNGNGKMTYIDGHVYEGSWVDGSPKGNGKITMQNGDIYEGVFDNDFVSGKCKILVNNYTYEGEWKEQAPNGIGQIIYTNGDIFNGLFVKGIAMGQGTLTIKTGEQIRGEWNNKKVANPIELSTADGIYKGNRVGTVLMDKKAIIIMKNGAQYQGEYNKGMNGMGILTLSNGDRIETFWTNGHYSEGEYVTYTWKNGCKVIGIIKKGEISKGKYYNADGSEAKKQESKTWIISAPVAISIVFPKNEHIQ